MANTSGLSPDAADFEGDAEGSDGPEYPPELDEFLEYCVHEHAGDFEAISREFLDIAAELEESLASRAHEFFSPEALRQRWKLLSGEEVEQGSGAPPPRVESGECPPSGESAPAAAEAQPQPVVAPAAQTSDIAVALEEPSPSGFSIFRDSLKEQIDQIYMDVQNRLPSTLGRMDSSDEDDDSGGMTAGADGAALRVVPVAPQLERRLAESASTGDEGATPDDPVAAQGGPAEKQAALGSLTLKEVLTRVAAVDSQGDMPALAQGMGISNDIASFEAVLLSHGVDPQNIEGPGVELPAEVRSVFGHLREALHFTDEAPKAAPAVVDAAGGEGIAQPEGQAAAARKVAAQAPASVPVERPEHKATSRAAAAAAAECEASEGTSEASGDSADEDFVQMRSKLKACSRKLMDTQGGCSTPAGNRGKTMPFAPPLRLAAAARPGQLAVPKASSQRPPPKFIKLELQDDTDSAASADEHDEPEGLDVEDDAADDDEDSVCGAAYLAQPLDGEPIRVMSRLLQKSPTGECPWDTWLESTKQYPRLQIVLGSPNFFRRDDQVLRVAFDVERLRTLLEEERQIYAERKQAQQERRERFQHGVAEFVKEAERRRELLGSRMGQGFVLQSRSPELENLHEESRRDRQAELEAEEKEQREAQERAERAKLQRAQERKREEVRAKKQEEERQRLEQRAKEESDRKRLETAMALRKERLVTLRAEVARHRCPLYDEHVSHAAAPSGLSSRALRLLEAAVGDDEACGLSAFLLPWGATQRGVVAVTDGQREALNLVHERDLAEAALLLPAGELEAALPGAAGAAGPLANCSAAVLLLVEAGVCANLLESSLPCGVAVREVLSRPLPLLAAAALFRRPLALWAAEDDLGGPSSRDAVVREPTPNVETVLVALKTGHRGVGSAALAALLAEAQSEGLSPVGVRLVFPDAGAARGATSATLRAVLKLGGPVMTIALRGPNALDLWRRLLGPADPQLARRTDPTSLNARFGGDRRADAVAMNPPSSASKAFADVVWVFGGRVPDDPALPETPVHALLVKAPERYGIRVAGPLRFANVSTVLGGVLLRAGKVLELSARPGADGGMFIAAVREGGGSFAAGCRRLLCAPVIDDTTCSPTSGSIAGVTATAAADVAACVAEVCDTPCSTIIAPWATSSASDAVPGHRVGGSDPASNAGGLVTAEELQKLGEPEVLVLGLRPRVVADASAMCQLLDGLFTKFGSLGSDALPSLCIGLGVDLLAMRLLDLGALRADDVAGEAALGALRSFRGFAHVVGRASDEDHDEWWAAPCDERSFSCRTSALLCFRGEDLIGRFRTFLSREWKLPAATSGGILFTPTPRAAQSVWRTFFGNHPETTVFEPTWPIRDLRSGLRFSGAVQLDDGALFPSRKVPELTAVLLVPPSVDVLLNRLLSSADQHGFTLVTAIVVGGLSEDLARTLFDQEVADGHLDPNDWGSFKESVGCLGTDLVDAEESQFRCIWVVLSRHQAVKRLAQLCGHADPAVNQQHFRVCLRLGRDRIHNGIRCPTSRASAQKILGALACAVGPCFQHQAADDAPGGRCLGVEASGVRSLECAFVCVALPTGAEMSAARLLNDLHWALHEKGVTLIGLRTFVLSAGAAADCPDNDAGVFGKTWPPGHLLVDATAQLKQWLRSRPSASAISDIALAGVPATVVMAACEGPMAAEHVRGVLGGLAGRRSTPGVKKCEFSWYSASGSSAAAADVACCFHELFGGLHYIVGP